MKNRLISERYAQALIEIAGKNSHLFLEQMYAVREVISENMLLKRFLWSPQVDDLKKQKLLQQVFSTEIDTVLLNFLKLLVKKGRINIVLGVVNSFEELYNNLNNISKITVVTAVPMSKKHAEALSEKLESVSGSKINLEFTVDAGIMGGMILQTPTKEMDGSIVRRLKDLKMKLNEVKV